MWSWREPFRTVCILHEADEPPGRRRPSPAFAVGFVRSVNGL